MSAAPLRLVVFDIDGTLVDSAALIYRAFDETFARLGRPTPPRYEIFARVGLSIHEALAGLMPGAGEDEVAHAVAAYREVYVRLRAEQGAGGVPLFAGARAALEALAARPDVLLGAATGMARRGLDHALDTHGLARWFVTRQSADLHPSKPHPAMLEAALAETGVEAANAVMVGDTSFDIEMAVNAGVTALGVSWGHHAPEVLEAAGARRVLGDFAELVPALETIWGER
jgi:phosphoglycolate phosphatase